jgi:hypothetical protein
MGPNPGRRGPFLVYPVFTIPAPIRNRPPARSLWQPCACARPTPKPLNRRHRASYRRRSPTRLPAPDHSRERLRIRRDDPNLARQSPRSCRCHSEPQLLPGCPVGARARAHGCPMVAVAQSADNSSIVIPMVRCRPLWLPQSVRAAATQADGVRWSPETGQVVKLGLP